MGFFHMRSLKSIFSRFTSMTAFVALLTTGFVIIDNPHAAHAGTVTTDSYGTVTLAYSYSGTISSTDCANPARGAGYFGDLFKPTSGGTTRLYMGTGWDTYLQVLDSNKTTILAQDDDSGVGYDSYINSVAVTTSQYVVATSYGQGGSGSYTLHSDIPLTQVTNCPQVITVSGAPASIQYGSTGTFSATTNMLQTVSVTSQTPSICSVTSAAPNFQINALSPGTCTVVSSQAGNGSIEAAISVTTNISITAKPLTITGLVGDKNYDGTTSTTLTGTAALSGIVGSDVVSLTGTPTGTYNVATAGTNTITVSGLSLTGAAASKYTLTNTFSGVISKLNQTMSWAPNTTLSTTNSGSTFTAATTTAGGGAITYAVTSAGTTGCTVSGTTLSFTTSGSCTVRATAAATTNYNVATLDSTFVISKVNQTIIWSPLTTLLAMPSSTILSAATTSGNGAITYAVTSAGTTGCTISGTTLTYSASGTCQVTATAAATNTYNVATSTLTFTIDKATQAAITVNAASSTITYKATTPATTNLSISGGSGTGAVSFAVTPASSSICSISGTTVTALNAGSCVVEATKAGDGVYLPRTGTITVTVAKGVQTNFAIDAASTSLTYSASPATTTEFSLTGGNGSGAEVVTVASGSESVCSIDGSTVTALSAGSCVLNATKSADTNYLDATDTVTITITKAAQVALTLSATRTSIVVVGQNTSELSFTGGSGTGAATWSLDSSSVGICSLSGTTVTAIASGSCVINLSKAAETNYNVATRSITLSVSAALQTGISVTAASTELTFSATDLTFTTLSFTGGSGTGRIWFETSDANMCVVGAARNTVNGIRATVTALHAGTCEVRGHKEGDANFAAAESMLIEIIVTKGAQSDLSISLESALTYSANPIASTHLLTLGGSGSGSVTYNLISGPCTLVANELSAPNAGDCVVRATKAADQDFTEMVVENTFTVAKANQAALTLDLADGSMSTIAWDGKKTSELEVAGGTGSGALSAATNSIEICTVSVSGSTATVTGTAAGTCTVTVTKATSTNYLAKSSTFEFTVIDLPTAPTNITITNTGVITDDGTAVEISWTPVSSSGTQAEVSGYEVQFKSGLNWVRADGGLVDAQTSSLTVYPTPWTALFIRVAPVSTFDAEDGVRHNWTNYTGTSSGTAPVAFNIAGRLDNISSPIVAASSGEPVIINGTDFDQAKTNQVEITTATAVLPARLGVAAVTTAVKTVPAVVISPTKLSFVVPKIALPTGSSQLSATVRVLSTTGVRSDPVSFNYVPKKLAQNIAVSGLPTTPNLVVGTAVNGNLSALGAVPAATSNANICTATIGDNGALRITPIAKGKCVVTIQAPATPGYTAAPAKVFNFTVLGVSQTITFADPVDRAWSNESFTLPVTAGSNLPVSVTSTTPLICNVVDRDVTMLKSGVCTLKATQAGSAAFEAATPVTQSFTITKANRSANLTATIQSLANDGTEAEVVIAASPSAPTQANVTVAIGTDPFDRVVTLSQREGTVLFTVDSSDDTAGRCIADAGTSDSLDGVITLTDLGSCKVTISQPADDRFNAGISVVIWINAVSINSNVAVPEDVDTGDAVSSTEDTDSSPADPDSDPAVALSLPSTGGAFDVGGDVGIGYNPTTGVLSISTKTAFVGTFKVTMTSPVVTKKWFTVSKKAVASCVLTLTVKKDAKLKKSVVRVIGTGCALSAEGKAALTAVGIQKVKIAYVFNRAYAKTGLAYMGTAKAKTRILSKVKRTIVLKVGRIS